MPRLYKSADRVVERARQAGVVGVIVSPIEPKFYKRALELADRFNGYVWVTFGLHPPQATPQMVERCLREMEKHADRILAIGEVGLDYHWVKDEQRREYQRRAFIQFIRLADQLDLPLVVHSREAEEDALQILREESAQRVQLHCFNQPSLVGQASRQGWYMSVPTSVVIRRRMQRVASAMPLDNMLLETDAPYLAPIPGQTNEPANIPRSISKIAELKGTSPEEVAQITTSNALKLFRLEPGSHGLRRS